MGSLDSQGDTFVCCYLIQNLRNKRGEGGTFCLHVANGERTIISIFADLALADPAMSFALEVGTCKFTTVYGHSFRSETGRRAGLNGNVR